MLKPLQGHLWKSICSGWHFPETSSSAGQSHQDPLMPGRHSLWNHNLSTYLKDFLSPNFIGELKVTSLSSSSFLIQSVPTWSLPFLASAQPTIYALGTTGNSSSQQGFQCSPLSYVPSLLANETFSLCLHCLYSTVQLRRRILLCAFDSFPPTTLSVFNHWAHNGGGGRVTLSQASSFFCP